MQPLALMLCYSEQDTLRGEAEKIENKYIKMQVKSIFYYPLPYFPYSGWKGLPLPWVTLFE